MEEAAGLLVHDGLPYEEVLIEGAGTALKATKNLSKGASVLSSRPEVTVMYSDYATSHCGLCYEPAGGDGAICLGCQSFTLCPDCAGIGDALRWHQEGECASFLEVSPGLRRGDTDYLRYGSQRSTLSNTTPSQV